MFPMRFNWNSWREMIDSIDAPVYVQAVYETPGFPIHPSASELAEQMLVDPEVLKNETYEPGIFDEDGDYYPQYTDDPSKLPEYFEPAPLNSGDTVPESAPAENVDVPVGESKDSE